MRIIHLVSPVAMNGAARYALQICNHYSKNGHEVVAMTRDAKAVDAQFEAAGIELEHAPLRDYPDFFSALALKPLLADAPEGQTVIHTHRYRDALTAIAARKLAKRPDVRIVVTSHHALPGRDNWLRRFIYRQIDAHLFVSHFARNNFLSTWPHGRYPFDPARLHVTWNSIPDDTLPEPLPEKGAVTAMYHGSLRPGKGLESIVDALALLKDTRLRLKIAGTGDPDFCDRLRTRALTFGVLDQIDWVRNPGNPAEYIKGTWFGILPSETPEAFGMANIEYMAAARAQITTFNGAQNEYLTPGREAIAVAPGDTAALADAMHLLASDKLLCEQMGQAARQTYEQKLAWTPFIQRIDAIYTGQPLHNDLHKKPK